MVNRSLADELLRMNSPGMVCPAGIPPCEFIQRPFLLDCRAGGQLKPRLIEPVRRQGAVRTMEFPSCRFCRKFIDTSFSEAAHPQGEPGVLIMVQRVNWGRFLRLSLTARKGSLKCRQRQS